jgi:hypothetical protein
VTLEDTKRLKDEFRILARHVASAEGTPYQQGKYIEAHEKLGLGPSTGFERFLLSVARMGAVGIWLADGYSGLLARKSIVRSKLVLTLALLECSPPTFAALDKPTRGGLWVALFATGLRGVEFVLALLLGTLVFAPAQLWFAATSPRR